MMHLIAPLLETQRLRLRAHQSDDFAPLAALFSTERSRFMDGPKSPEDVWRGFVGDAGQWSILGYGAWAIELRASGEYIGQVGLNRPLDFPEDELGWLLFDGWEGKGYAYEAVERARAFAFEVLRLPTLVSYIDPDNRRSIALAERLGAELDPAATRPHNEPCLVFRHRAHGQPGLIRPSAPLS